MTDWRTLVSGAGTPIASGGLRLPQGRSPRKLQRLLGMQRYALSRQAAGYFPSLLKNFADLANQDRFSGEGRSAFLTPRLNAINDAQRAAAGNLTQDLASRGLSDSSAMATGLGQIESSAGTARSSALSGLYDAEQQRQEQAKGNLAALLNSMLSQGNQGADILGQLRSQDLQQAQFDRAGQFDWGSLFSGIGGIGGSFLGAGGLAGLLRKNKPNGMAGSGWPAGSY